MFLVNDKTLQALSMNDLQASVPVRNTPQPEQ